MRSSSQDLLKLNLGAIALFEGDDVAPRGSSKKSSRPVPATALR